MEPEPAPDLHDELPAPRTVVFDIGEVLIDETRVWATWADLVGVSPLTFAAVLGAAVAQGEELPAVFAHVAPNVVWWDLVDEHERRLGGLQAVDLYADARPCLEALTADGFTVVVVGNQPARRRAQLEALGLACQVLVTSEELGHEKPDPAFFAAVQQLVTADRATEVLYVGDRVDNDVVPAAAAGMRTCWLRRGPWGQLQELPDGIDADLVLDGLGELPELLHTWRDEEEHGGTSSHG